MKRFAQTLRGRLVLACLAVEAVVGTVLLGYGSHQLLEKFADQAQWQARQLVTTLDHATATPLAQRDYAALQQLLDLVRQSSDVAYLVLSDHRGVRIAASGWAGDKPLPPRDQGPVDLHRDDSVWHSGAQIDLAGQMLGRLDLGLSTDALRAAHHDFLWRGAGTGAMAIGLSGLLLGLISLRMTRRLSELARASEKLTTGQYDVVLTTDTQDELGQLSSGFNRMANTVKQRVEALQTSEALQREQMQVVDAERRRLQALLGALRHGIVLLDEAGRVVYANQAFVQLWRLGEDPTGQGVTQLVQPMAAQAADASAAFVRTLASPPGSAEALPELRLRDGRLVVHQRHVVPSGGCLWVQEDVTADRLTQQRAEQALVDPLTRLANRRGLFETLQAALAAGGAAGTPLALLFIDLDDFKRANDLGGHRSGDQLLAAVAAGLAAELRAGQIVARLGGDEFAVMSPATDAEDAVALAARLVAAVGRVEVAAGPLRLRTGCSVGVAVSPVHAGSADELVACADTAMYQAKHAGKGQWALYSAEAASVRAQSARMDWNERIRRALDSGRFVLHFQPVVSTGDRLLQHYEALVRMVDEFDAERLIEPSHFISQAERSGRIVQIDRWVLATCIEHLTTGPADLVLAANLSIRSLEDPGFISYLIEGMRRHSVDPRRLHIELTETMELGDESVAARHMAQLRGLGFQLHMDDFGAGFNTFSRLKRLAVDTVKIDGVFIRDIERDPVHRLLVGALVQVARSMYKRTIAEHVESEAAWTILEQLGVDMVQGRCVGEPRPWPLLADPTGAATAPATIGAGAAPAARPTIAAWTPAPHSPAEPANALNASVWR